jgi:hypothetical protein
MASTEKEIEPSCEKEVPIEGSTEVIPPATDRLPAVFDSTDIERLKGLINDEAG